MLRKCKHIAVFDGTSAYIIHKDELTNDVEIIGQSNSFDIVESIVDKYNEENCNLIV